MASLTLGVAGGPVVAPVCEVAPPTRRVILLDGAAATVPTATPPDRYSDRRNQMILKYQTLDGAWRTLDGVTEVINHGYIPHSDVFDMARAYDGDPVFVNNPTLPLIPSKGRPADNCNPDPDTADDLHVLYLVFTIRGQREHWAFRDLQQGYVLSDDGKTVDRLLN